MGQLGDASLLQLLVLAAVCLILQGADDQIAAPENGVELQKEVGERATLVNVPGAAHLLPLEQPETAASHMIISFESSTASGAFVEHDGKAAAGRR
jgi:pimeloyl-ACP methyl ester carboxylesterase